MPKPVSEPSSVTLTGTAAQLFVADVGRACDFYVHKLGFAVDFTHGEPPFYGAVRRDRAQLTLRRVCEPVFAGDIRERESLLSASVTVDSRAEIEALFRSCEAAGVVFHQRLAVQPWGAADFILRDPDGNLVLFAGPTD